MLSAGESEPEVLCPILTPQYNRHLNIQNRATKMMKVPEYPFYEAKQRELWSKCGMSIRLEESVCRGQRQAHLSGAQCQDKREQAQSRIQI